MPAITGERYLSRKTSSVVAKLLSPIGIGGTFSWGSSSVVFSLSAGF